MKPDTALPVLYPMEDLDPALREDAEALHHALGDLLRDNPDCLPVALTRAGRALLPDTETVLQAGDLLNVSATFAGIKNLRSQLFSGKEA